MHDTGSSDFEEFSPILTHGNSEISLLTVDDGITLEYDDSVILTYTPQTTNLTDLIASAGEFVRDNATLIITDNDSELSCSAAACVHNCSVFCSGLEIYFEESEYTVREDEAGVTPVHLKLRKTQNPFVLTLRPMSIDDAESVFNVGNFINSDTIMEYSRATPGMDYMTAEHYIIRYCGYLWFAGLDFREESFTGLVPATEDDSGIFSTLPMPYGFRIRIHDDQTNENEQSFALFARIGIDVKADVACFWRQASDTDCFGRVGATKITIIDNDSECPC